MANGGFALHPVDIGVIVGYIVVVVAVGLLLARSKEDTAEGYFLAGRSMIWPFIGISLFASNISSTTLVGLAGSAYDTGIAVFNYEWMAALILAFYAVFMLPFVLRAKVFTMPEFLERRFDRRARSYFSVLLLFLNIVVDTAGSLYAGALILKLVFPEIPIWQTVAVLAVLAGAYTILGGLTAVIYTDALQGVILIVGSIAISAIAYDQVGGWSQVLAGVPADKLSLIRPIGDPAVPWPGLLFGVTLLGFYFWCTNQFMTQRILSAKNVDHGRWGALFAGLLKLPVLFIMVLPGTFAILLFPDLPKGDLVFPTLMFELLPIGLLGLVFAGFIAALMSQIDSTLNSASTLVTMDFVARDHPDYDPRRLKRVGQFVTFLFMLLAVLWAPQIERFGGLFDYLQAVLSYTVPPVVAMFLFGLFWKRANAQGAFAALLVGVIALIGLMVSGTIYWPRPPHDVIGMHFLYVAPVLFVASSAVLVVVSLMTAPPDAETIRPYIWTRAFFDAETEELAGRPWYQNYRILAALLVAMALIIVVQFW